MIKEITPLKVSAALLVCGERVLIAQRPAGKAHEGKWEFPGGKVELGETSTDSIIRELKEELDITLSPQNIHFFLNSTFRYSVGLSVDIDSFLCSDYEGEIKPQENQRIEWVRINALLSKDLLEADVQIAQCLFEWLSKSSE